MNILSLTVDKYSKLASAYVKLHTEKEQLQALVEELELDLAFAEETIEMYEEEEDRQIDVALDAAVDKMFDRAFL